MRLKQYFKHIYLCIKMEHRVLIKIMNFIEGIFFRFRKLHHVEVIVTTRCNLRCKHCSNMIPEIQDKAKDVSFEEFKRDFDFLMTNFDFIYRLQIHGGEPLLHTEIDKILAYVLTYKKKIGVTLIITNGTNVPSQQLMDVISENKVVIASSSYEINKPMRDKISSICRDNNVYYVQFATKQWFVFGPPIKEEYKISELKSKFSQCPTNEYPAYKNGRLYLCARLANLLDYQDNLTDDGVDLSHLSKNNAQKFLMKDYSENCKYCHIKENEFCNAAEQKKNSKEYL